MDEMSMSLVGDHLEEIGEGSDEKTTSIERMLRDQSHPSLGQEPKKERKEKNEHHKRELMGVKLIS